MTTPSQQHKPERGGLLSAFLIFIMVYSALSFGLVWYLMGQGGTARFPWALPVLAILALVDIVSAVAIWNWKKWGLWLFIATTIVSIVVGLIVTRTQLWVFHDIWPLIILGYLVRGNLKHFD